MKKEKIKLILVVGVGHSGSTILDLIMNAHSQIFGVGEISHYKRMRDHNALCGCGKIMKECFFWNNIVKDVNWNFLPLIGRSFLNMIFFSENYVYIEDGVYKKLDIEKYIDEFEKIYENILKVSGKKIIFDSSKDPDRVELLIKSGKFDIVLLHLVRNGKGTVYSHIKLGRKPLEYMKEWFLLNLKTEVVGLRNKKIKKIFFLYEDFAVGSEKIIKFILEQVDLNFEPEMLKNFRSKEHHEVGGNYKVKFEWSSQEIYLDEKWKKEMSWKDKSVFNLLFGWLNFFYKIKSKNYE